MRTTNDAKRGRARRRPRLPVAPRGPCGRRQGLVGRVHRDGAAVDRRRAGRRLHRGEGEGHLPQRQVGDLRPEVPQARRHDRRGRWQRGRRPRRLEGDRHQRQLRADGLRRAGRQLADGHPGPPRGGPAPRQRPRARDPVRVPGAAPELPGGHDLRQLLVKAPRGHGALPHRPGQALRRARAHGLREHRLLGRQGRVDPLRLLAHARGTRTSPRRSTSPTRRSARASAPRRPTPTTAPTSTASARPGSATPPRRTPTTTASCPR